MLCSPVQSCQPAIPSWTCPDKILQPSCLHTLWLKQISSLKDLTLCTFVLWIMGWRHVLRINFLTMFTDLSCVFWSRWFDLSPFPSVGHFGIGLRYRNLRTMSVPLKFPFLWDFWRYGNKLPTDTAETTATHFLMKYAAKTPLQRGEERG